MGGMFSGDETGKFRMLTGRKPLVCAGLARMLFRARPVELMPESSQPVTALVVDDERYFRRFVGELLQAQGIAKTVEAADGNEALQMFPVVRPHLVILDINMPRSDGLEVLRGIRAQAPAIPVVMLTSIADEAVVEKCVDEGATYFIRKDVPAHELSRELRELLRDFAPPGEASAP